MSSWWCNALFHFLFAEDVRYADWFRYVLKYNLLVYYLTVCNSLVTYHIDGKLRNLFKNNFLLEISSSGNLIWQIFESTSHSKHKTYFSLPKCKARRLIYTYWPTEWVIGRESNPMSWGADPVALGRYLMTESQIFSRPARPHSVIEYFTIWPQL